MSAKIEWALIIVGILIAGFLALAEAVEGSQQQMPFDPHGYYLQHDILSVPLREIDQ